MAILWRKTVFLTFFFALCLLPAAYLPADSDESASLKSELRKKNEFPALRKLSGKITDKIGSILLRSVENDEPVLLKVDFSDSPYVLTDGTILSQSHPAELEVFVWQILEHDQAAKTVFLFPYSDGGAAGAYGKFLKMNELALDNPDRMPVVFPADPAVVPERSLRKEEEFYDFSGAMAGLSPSLAFFFQNKAAELPDPGSARAGGLDYAEGERKIDAALKAEYEANRADLESHYKKYAELQAEAFLLAIETSIQKAVALNRIADGGRIARINELQLKFAGYYRKSGPAGLAGDAALGVEAAELFASIDEICGSNTKDIFLATVKESARKLREEEELLSRLRAAQAERKSALMAELEHGIRTARNNLVSDGFSSLAGGAIGFCELPAADLQQQMSLCLTKQEYNLVIFHPGSRPEKAAALRPDPRALAAVLKDNALPEDFFRDLVIPELFRENYQADTAIRAAIRRTYVHCRAHDGFYRDGPLQPGQIGIRDTRVAGLGSLLRVVFADEGTQVGAKYYFLPGVETEERVGFIEESLALPDVPEREKRIFSKVAKILAAARDL